MQFQMFIEKETGDTILEITDGTEEEAENLINELATLQELMKARGNIVQNGASYDGEELENEKSMVIARDNLATILGCSVTLDLDSYQTCWADDYGDDSDDETIDCYLVWCGAVHSNGWDCYYATVRLANTAPDKPTDWDWSSSNKDATEEQTEAAYTAITEGIEGTEGGNVSDFHHLVWNDMVNKVKEILDYLGSSWTEKDNDGNTYLSYDDTLMSDSDTTLTADRFNALRFNIGSRYSTGIDPVEAGTTVYGQYFITLADCINGWLAEY